MLKKLRQIRLSQKLSGLQQVLLLLRFSKYLKMKILINLWEQKELIDA